MCAFAGENVMLSYSMWYNIRQVKVSTSTMMLDSGGGGGGGDGDGIHPKYLRRFYL